MDYYWGFNGRVKKHKETRISYINKKKRVTFQLHAFPLLYLCYL